MESKTTIRGPNLISEPLRKGPNLSQTTARPTEADAWAQCPCPDKCRSVGMKHPCLECWDDAGDIEGGLRLKELNDEN